MFKNALVSCSDKSRLDDFLRRFSERDLRILSTGGTAKFLREKKFNVVDVSDQTDFPEVMDGRVKTLHPKIHMALLARGDRDSDLALLKQYQIEPFDLVIGNLYPFESDPDVETIDIGGPSFLRAAAKNFARIAVLCDPADYDWVADKVLKGEFGLADRQKLAAKVFAHTSAYDSMIAKFYGGDDRLQFQDFSLGGHYVQGLRYGENPGQIAGWFRSRGEKHGLHDASILQGKELSYNNLLDLEAAVSTVREFPHQAACIAVKHGNPCGAAADEKPFQALLRALKADPQSVFGGIVAANFSITGEMAEELSNIFLECVVAPHFEESSKAIFQKKKNVRLLEWQGLTEGDSSLQVRTVLGGFLVQSRDRVSEDWSKDWRIVGANPSEKVRRDLLLAWKICAHLKSNAISIAAGGSTVGLGMGQVNRVDAVEQAVKRMRHFHPRVEDPVLASDAFFPFADSIEIIADAGIRYVIQPGGSVKDQEVIDKAKERGVTLVLTGQRHFLH